jgi:hypothetical protein
MLQAANTPQMQLKLCQLQYSVLLGSLPSDGNRSSAFLFTV